MKVFDFYNKKQAGKKITMLTCYDFATAAILKDSDVDCFLVGDSVSMVMHGFPDTTHATMDMMSMHVSAVSRAKPKQFIIGDMPFFSFQISDEDTLINVKRLIQAGAQAVKLEGASDDILRRITKITKAGIPVMGHLGLTPQSIHQMGGHKVQGRDEKMAEDLIKKAKDLEKAGIFSLVLECIPAALAKIISDKLSIATIGIGAGCDTDGQVLVVNDMLGFNQAFKPKFLKHFATLQKDILLAANSYASEVNQQIYPKAKEHTYV